jgi:hypothetical protein
MKDFTNRSKALLMILLFSVLAFGCASSVQSVAEPNDEPIVVLTELLPASTITPVPPTETASPLPLTETDTAIPINPSNTPTVVPTETLTHTPAPTFTEAPPIAVLDQDAGCRAGPSTFYRILAYLSAGDSGIVDGRTEDTNWLRIQLQEVDQPCWVFSDFISQEGDLASIAILTPQPLPTQTIGPTQEPSGPKYFLVIPDNGGPFACGDGLVYFYSNKKGKSLEENIEVALNALFSVKSEYVGDYYNPIYQSNMRVKRVVIENGKASIYLGGKFVNPKSDCEAKRMHQVIWSTAWQFGSLTHRPVIWINNVLLGDLIENVKK